MTSVLPIESGIRETGTGRSGYHPDPEFAALQNLEQMFDTVRSR